MANSCSSVNFNFLFSFDFFNDKGFLSTFSCLISIYPFFTNEFIVSLETPEKFIISGIVSPWFFIINSIAFFCFSPLKEFISISFSLTPIYTKFIFLSCSLFSISLLFVPGVNINFIHSDTLQKYFLAIHLASLIFSSDRFSSKPAISFTSNSVFCFIFITYPCSNVLKFAKGTKTLLPIVIISSNFSGIL